ncbi:MAG TPA: nucleotide sugar dehydrogenase [Candidatus Moranbacteria bacterium]|nr:nucleotide sugar dehydrogenase [Candidatus Moranbacteria bacterium]
MKRAKDNNVAVIGLGYVGLPVALICAENGYNVFGIDLDKEKLKKIKKGTSPFKEDFIQRRKEWLKKIAVSDKGDKIKKADIVVVCVPTPVDKNFYPNLKPIISATKMIIENINKGQLVIIESTVNPGVCEEVIEPIFKEAGLKEGRDYYLAHCPERIDPGKSRFSKGFDLVNTNRVVGAMSKKGLKRAVNFYESILSGEVRPMKSIRAAEAVKIVENSFRDINLAFVNELARSFDRMGIDVKDVIEGAATKPYSFMPHWPSCGVGGHCIPVDPYYLIERAKEGGFDHKLLRMARETNNEMPSYTVELLQDALNELKLPLKGVTIGIMGLAYKPNVDDTRESPSFKIMDLLEEKGAKVVTYDPLVPGKSTVKDLKTFLKKSTAVIFATEHQEFLEMDLGDFKKYGVLAIIDGKNYLDSEKIKALGINYHGIGRA